MKSLLKNRFLITTALEDTWTFDRPVVFLGEWCRCHERRKAWEKLDAQIVPYHWSDLTKLGRDYTYLVNCYERLLIEVSNALNEYHQTKHSKHYWRILIGPWLSVFLQVLFDRWEMIQRAVIDFQPSGTAILSFDKQLIIPNDMESFLLGAVDDSWNHYIYGYILKSSTDVACEEIEWTNSKSEDFFRKYSTSDTRSIIRRVLSSTAKRVSGIRYLTRPTEYFFVSEYMSVWTKLLLQAYLRQIPKLWSINQIPEIEPDFIKRKQFVITKTGKNRFENCVRSLIPEQIPTIYLEGFGKLMESTFDVPWPTKPRLIYTSTNYSWDEIFKAWAASKVENGSKLMIGQHGGGYGLYKRFFPEYVELGIADEYLSWGWKTPNNQPNDGIAVRLLGSSFKKQDSHDAILMITSEMHRYLVTMFSGVNSSQMLEYLTDEFRFCRAMPPGLRNKLIIRLSRRGYGWSSSSRWRENVPDVKLDDGTSPIQSLIAQSRLCVIDYFATSVLETLYNNFPTILFGNPKYWELSDTAQPYFDRFRQLEIFHENPESAARKVTEIWDNVDLWWSDSEIQEARKQFCERFARVPKNPVRALAKLLKQTANGKAFRKV